MRAVVTARLGGLEVLEFHTDWPDPEPAPGEVLIAVGACGLNATDVNTRTGWYSKQVRDDAGTVAADDATESREDDATWTGARLGFPRIQGADICGRVIALGESVSPDLLGRRVLVEPCVRDPHAPGDMSRVTYIASERDGGYADLVAVPAANANPIESPLTDVELASFPTSYSTALNMLRRAGLTAGETLLVTGASGGVGGALIGLARTLGATPIGIAGASKAASVQASGAAHVIARGTADLAGALNEATGRATVDVVADVVGGSGFPRLLEVLRPAGRYVCSGAIGGPIVELDLRTLYLRDLALLGATTPAAGLFGDLIRLIEQGDVRPIVAATYPLERLRDAQAQFMEKRHVGNIVIDVAAGR